MSREIGSAGRSGSRFAPGVPTTPRRKSRAPLPRGVELSPFVFADDEGVRPTRLAPVAGHRGGPGARAPGGDDDDEDASTPEEEEEGERLFRSAARSGARGRRHPRGAASSSYAVDSDGEEEEEDEDTLSWDDEDEDCEDCEDEDGAFEDEDEDGEDDEHDEDDEEMAAYGPGAAARAGAATGRSGAGAVTADAAGTGASAGAATKRSTSQRRLLSTPTPSVAGGGRQASKDDAASSLSGDVAIDVALHRSGPGQGGPGQRGQAAVTSPRRFRSAHVVSQSLWFGAAEGLQRGSRVTGSDSSSLRIDVTRNSTLTFRSWAVIYGIIVALSVAFLAPHPPQLIISTVLIMLLPVVGLVAWWRAARSRVALDQVLRSFAAGCLTMLFMACVELLVIFILSWIGGLIVISASATSRVLAIIAISGVLIIAPLEEGLKYTFLSHPTSLQDAGFGYADALLTPAALALGLAASQNLLMSWLFLVFINPQLATANNEVAERWLGLVVSMYLVIFNMPLHVLTAHQVAMKMVLRRHFRHVIFPDGDDECDVAEAGRAGAVQHQQVQGHARANHDQERQLLHARRPRLRPASSRSGTGARGSDRGRSAGAGVSSSGTGYRRSARRRFSRQPNRPLAVDVAAAVPPSLASSLTPSASTTTSAAAAASVSAASTSSLQSELAPALRWRFIYTRWYGILIVPIVVRAAFVVSIINTLVLRSWWGILVSAAHSSIVLALCGWHTRYVAMLLPRNARRSLLAHVFANENVGSQPVAPSPSGVRPRRTPSPSPASPASAAAAAATAAVSPDGGAGRVGGSPSPPRGSPHKSALRSAGRRRAGEATASAGAAAVGEDFTIDLEEVSRTSMSTGGDIELGSLRHERDGPGLPS